MFSGGSGHRIHGGNFYDVAGDMNLYTRQPPHVTIPSYKPLGEASGPPGQEDSVSLPAVDGLEGSIRALSGGAKGRRPAVRDASRLSPYDIFYRRSQILNARSSPIRSYGGNGPHSTEAPRAISPLFPPIGSQGSVPMDPKEDSIPAHFGSTLFHPNSDASSMHGATFITAENVHHYHSGETEISMDILHRAATLDALYDSAASFPQPRCHPETRTQMIDTLYDWTSGNSSPHAICWLYGPAGAGKSAIMQTLCRRLQENGRLGGSFFFKRGHPTRGNAQALFATLAYQLALQNSDMKQLILRRVEENPTVVARDLEIQLRELIVEPCLSSRSPSPRILLVDGLDECAGEQAQQQVLRLIKSTARYPTTFRVLIASRPEAHIRDVFDDSSFCGNFEAVNIEQSFQDVRKYLRDEFARIHREHPTTMGDIPAPWPSEDVIQSLAEKSSGYFIYASTVIKFIDDKYSRPAERLAAIQNPSSDSDSPFTTLDQLYHQILSGVPSRFRERLCEILCVVANFQLRADQIDGLLSLEPGDVQLTLRSLHSLLRLDQKPLNTYNYPITVHHASFLDFLHDPCRSLAFHISLDHRMAVARAILRALSYIPRIPRGAAGDLPRSVSLSSNSLAPF
ncbi:hypothetical protein GGX14DRAFT_523834 [Mycena pura]|uniref:NACHT domain-containing protein n=1 Tax=Mycena pura TaxID=153505 RepID=A0AAD6Y6W3_9AGAR|nr:hypothetical protein GGX14DRAFT_523834 [Mycena pura]